MSVGLDLNGIQHNVSNVSMERYGTNPHWDVYAQEEQLRMISQENVGWCKSVEMVKHGIKISGSANVQQIQYLMEYIVSWTPAQMEDSGMIKQKHASVQIRRYGIQEHVSLQE